MSFNAGKCHVLHITRKKKTKRHEYILHGQVLTAVDHHPYLGIEFSSDLKWSTHIDQVVNKGNKMLGFLRRNMHRCSREVKEAAYKTLVRPKLEYASVAWDPHSQTLSQKLEMMSPPEELYPTRPPTMRSPLTAPAL